MVPNTVILETAPQVRWFNNFVDNKGLALDLMGYDVLGAIFEYIMGMDDAYGCLLAYSMDMQDIISGCHSEENVLAFGQAITAVGFEFYSRLIESGCYDTNGVCWYKYKGILRDNIVLEYCGQITF